MASSNPSPFRLAQLSPLRAGRARWWIGAISAGVGLLVGTPMGVLGDELANEKIELFPEKLGPLPAQAPPAPLPSLSAQTCNACHGAIHDEWKASGHSRASTNLVYRKSVEALGNPTLCDNCHLPLENQRASLPKGPGGLGRTARVENPAYEPTLAQEGVTCAVCHVRQGVILGPRELPPERAPHPIVKAEELSGVQACSYCHQLALKGAGDHPYLDTVGEWQRSPFGQAGIVCQECHMPRVSGVISGSRYAAYSSHRGLGAPDPEAVARALTLEVKLRSARLERGETLRAEAQMMNTGAGHTVPTGDPAHQLELRFAVLDPQGGMAKGAVQSSLWLHRTVEPDPPFRQVSDARLEAASSRSFDYAYTPTEKQNAGTYTLVVTLNWWAASPEQARAIGLSEDQVRLTVSRQEIPFEVF